MLNTPPANVVGTIFVFNYRCVSQIRQLNLWTKQPKQNIGNFKQRISHMADKSSAVFFLFCITARWWCMFFLWVPSFFLIHSYDLSTCFICSITLVLDKELFVEYKIVTINTPNYHTSHSSCRNNNSDNTVVLTGDLCKLLCFSTSLFSSSWTSTLFSNK